MILPVEGATNQNKIKLNFLPAEDVFRLNSVLKSLYNFVTQLLKIYFHLMVKVECIIAYCVLFLKQQAVLDDFVRWKHYVSRLKAVSENSNRIYPFSAVKDYAYNPSWV